MKIKAISKLFTLLMIGALMFASCGSSKLETKEDFVKLGETLKSKFGENAHFTSITIASLPKGQGSSIALTVAKDPSSLKMEEWVCSNGSWMQTSDVSIQIPEGSVAEDFMVSQSEVSLAKLGDLLELTMKKTTEESQLQELRFANASILVPNKGNKVDTRYMVVVEPKNGGTKFTAFYDINGELISFTY